jgi:hypothetical protein
MLPKRWVIELEPFPYLFMHFPTDILARTPFAADTIGIINDS